MLASPALLHIPDGFLTPVVAALGWAIAVVVLVLGLRRTGRQLGDRMVPVMGVLAAFIFAAQAINFPVAAGTSGHLIGAALAAIVLGPWASLVVMTVVIGTQALLLQDGGLIALGWNVVNMGALAAFSGYASYRGVVRVAGEHATARLGGAFAAAWVSVEAGAIATTLELAASGTTDINLALPAMTSVHALIGLGEGLVTVGALTLLIASRPEILRQGEGTPGGVQAAFVLAGVVLALLLALAAPLAASSPDGLQAVALALGFSGREQAARVGPAANYLLPGVGNAALATIAAIAIGTLLVFAAAIAIGLFGRRGRGDAG
jgi:cobalt/nickel transport system permease protein